MSRLLIVVGVVLVVVGALWPWIARTGLGRLPGDFLIERGSFRFYFPLATSILVSAIVTLILWLFRR